jgi:hypothetical protein
MYPTEQNLGQGGPTQLNLDAANQYLFMLEGTPNTVYFYDKTKKIFVPFSSEQGFLAFAGRSPEQAWNNGEVHQISEDVRKQLGVVLGNVWFNDQGELNDPAYINSIGDASGLDGLYGKRKNSDAEKKAADYIGQLFTTFKNSGVISQDTFNKTISDPINLARYVNAWVYGGYNADDIFREVKAKELGMNVKAFDSTKTADEFKKDPSYSTVKYNTQLNPPQNLGLDTRLLESPIFDIPDKAFETIIPVLDKNSPEFKAEAEKIKDAYHDLLIQQLEANTAQTKAVADDNYRIFKDQIEKKYGIALADNASDAWGQISQLTTGMSEKGLGYSGIFNEAQDRLLADRREADQRLRDEQVTTEEAKRREYYLNQATPEQIQKDLTEEEKVRWGLKPTQETLDFINNLKTNYPDLSDSEIQNMKDSLIDVNGNLRSQLYSNLYANRYNYQKQKTLYQEQTLEAQKANETQKAYAPYSTGDTPFSQYQDTITPPTTTPVSNTQPYIYPKTTPNTTTTPSSVQNTPAGPITNWGGVPNQTTQSTPSMQDLSSRYGLYNGTVYAKDTGFGFSKPEEFFQASGVKDFSNVKLDSAYKPTFYKYSDNPTVYNAYNNTPLDYDSYIKSGGNPTFSGIETRKR